MIHKFRPHSGVGGLLAFAVASAAPFGATPAQAQDAGQPAGAVSAAAAPLSPADQTQWNPIQSAIDRQDYKTAEGLLRTWLTTHQDDHHAQFLLGYSLMFQNKTAAALDTFNTLLAADPENPDYLFGKANTLVRAGRSAEAIPILDHVRQIGTNTEPVYRLEIQALKNTGDQAKLQEVQREAAQKYPGTDWYAVANPPAVNLPTYVQAQYTHDSLDNGFGNWDTFDLTANKWLAPRESVFGGLETTRRFGLSDQAISAGINYPLAPKTSLVFQLSASPTHKVLPTYSALLQLGQSLGGGWGVYVGEQHAAYNPSGVAGNFNTDAQYITLEKWIKLVRVADTVTRSEISGGLNGVSDTFQINQYYGPGSQSTIGLGIGGGKTVVSLGPPRGVITATTTDVDLGGVHYVTPLWAAVYDFGYHKLGGLFTRKTISLGVRRQF